MRLRLFLTAVPGALLAASAVPATTLVRMSLEEMTSAAQAVARVRCISNQTRWEDSEIWTFTSFEVTEAWKGSLPRRITVRLLGGRIDHLISTVPGVPRFRPGEEVVLFLEPSRAGSFSVIGWAQGTFRIHRASPGGPQNATEDTSSISTFDPRTREFRHEGILGIELEILRDRVLSAVAQQRRDKQ